MNTLNFLDANVWLALLWSRHIHSARAQEWFEEVSEEQFFFCRFTTHHISIANYRKDYGKRHEDNVRSVEFVGQNLGRYANFIFSRTRGPGTGIPVAFTAFVLFSKSLGGCISFGVRFSGGVEVRYFRSRAAIAGQ